MRAAGQKLHSIKDQLTPRKSSGNLTQPDALMENTAKVSDIEEVDEDRDLPQESLDILLSFYSREPTSVQQCTSQTPPALSGNSGSRIQKKAVIQSSNIWTRIVGFGERETGNCETSKMLYLNFFIYFLFLSLVLA